MGHLLLLFDRLYKAGRNVGIVNVHRVSGGIWGLVSMRPRHIINGTQQKSSVRPFLEGKARAGTIRFIGGPYMGLKCLHLQ